MKVRFYERSGVDWVAIQSGFDGKDEVHRIAAPEDRHRFAVEYAAFRPPPPKVSAPVVPDVKSAKKQRE